MFDEGVMRTINHAARCAPWWIREDARQEAAVGVLEAMPRFDPSRGFKLRTFVTLRARGAVKDLQRRMDPASKDHRSRIRAGEVADVCMCSLDREAYRVPDAGATPEDLAITCCAHDQLRVAIEKLRQRDRKVLVRFYWERWTLKEIGVELGVHESRAYQIRQDAIDALREMMRVA